MPHSRKQARLRPKNSSGKLKARITSLTNSRRLIIARLLIIIGVLFFLTPTIYRAIKKAPTSSKGEMVSEPREESQNSDYGPIKLDPNLLSDRIPTQPPLRIVVPTRKIDLSIVEARVVNGYWELSETTASHGVGSANPGENGNIVVFAHARDGLFGPMRDLQKDELIYLLTKDRWFRYRVEETKLVEPTAIETITQTKDEQLTLFTCSGFLDTKRLIVTAKPFQP